MTPHAPLVSVALVTFNHEKYIADCIRSVLRQSFADIELVIVDDGSTDGTPGVIAGFADPRLVSIRQENQGPSAALNRAIAACRGRFTALMSGDDLCHLDRIEMQLAAHRDAGGGVVFSNADYIDDDGNPIENGLFGKDFFLTPGMSQARILERFFTTGNFCAAPTCLAETQDLRDAGPFDPLLYQLQDYDMWIRLVKRKPFTFMPACTISYRSRPGDMNLSTPNPSKVVRMGNELHIVFRHFFDGVSVALFREAFREQLINPDSGSPAELACEQAFLFYRNTQSPLIRLIGMEKLHDLLLDAETTEILRQRCRYTRADFVNDLLQLDATNHLERFRTNLFVDTGNGYQPAGYVTAVGNHDAAEFDISFDLSQFPPVREVRWDPVIHQLCRCRLEEVTWLDSTGATHALPVIFIWSNGRSKGLADFTFEHLCPTIFLPISGSVHRLRLRGQWQVTDSGQSHLHTHLRLFDQAQQLGQLKQRDEENARQLKHLDQELQIRNAQLQDIFHSRSWRLLTKLKSVVRFRNRARRT